MNNNKNVSREVFVKIFKKVQHQKHLTIKQVTKSCGFSQNYLYGLLNKNNKQKTIRLKTIIEIGKGLGLKDRQLKGWTNTMKLIHPIKNQVYRKKERNNYKNDKRHHYKNNRYYHHQKYHFERVNINRLKPVTKRVVLKISKLNNRDIKIISKLIKRLA